MIKLNINGTEKTLSVEPETPLLWALRDELDLQGTRFGCGAGLCGACTVHVDGAATRSCVTEIQDVVGTQITTIEGLSADGSHPVKQAWAELDVPQCGYCQSGQIMAASALLHDNPKPTDEDINNTMTNICRCHTYGRIRKGVKRAAEIASTS